MSIISIVIVCKNEIAVIEDTIVQALKLSPYIIVVDSGSTDGTLDILEKYDVTIIKSNWLGFGPTKNIGIAHALTNWILSIDADERVDDELIAAIKKADFTNEQIAYKLRRRNYLGNTPLRFGEWGTDKHVRLFHKKIAHWNDAMVHETLIYKEPIVVKILAGFMHHKTAEDKIELHQKMEDYAQLNATHYFTNGKRNSHLKMFFSPTFNFVINYIFKLGFLDGKAGFIVAQENAIYTYKKYLYLHQLINKTKRD
jgi:glycosyltransferase involved in cell wall biosynthesis